MKDRLLKREVVVSVLLVCEDEKPLSSERNCRFCPTISGTVLKTGMEKLQGFGGLEVLTTLRGVVSKGCVQVLPASWATHGTDLTHGEGSILAAASLGLVGGGGCFILSVLRGLSH